VAECKVIVVPEDCCYITFDRDVANRPLPANRERGHCIQLRDTARGETVLAELDAQGRIIGIELLGGKKPCQNEP
jgi:hypothetical protein